MLLPMLRLNLSNLLPSLCALCHQPSPASRICSGCRSDLPGCGPACWYCAEPLPAPLAVPCARCQHRRPPWRRCVAALPYAWPVDHALKALKYSRQLLWAAALGELLPPVFEREFADCDALAPVPLYRWRHARRGFNQATELCRPLQRATGLPLLGSLRRVRNTRPQSGLGRKQRRKNLQRAFEVQEPLACHHPLLIDDVMTTGETCRQLTKLLLAAGAESVSVLVVARAAGDHQTGGASLKV